MIWASGGNLARTPGLHPYSFTRSAMGFLMIRESQVFGLTSHPKDGAFDSIASPSLYWGVRTHTDCRVSTPYLSHPTIPSEAPPWDSRPVSGAGVVHYHSLHRPRSVPTALGPAPHLFQQQPSFPRRSSIQVLTRLSPA